MQPVRTKSNVIAILLFLCALCHFVGTMSLPDHHQQRQQHRSAELSNPIVIQSSCACGGFQVKASFPSQSGDHHRQEAPEIFDCSCESCRRYHASPFVRFIKIPVSSSTTTTASASSLNDEKCSISIQVVAAHDNDTTDTNTERKPELAAYTDTCQHDVITTAAAGVSEGTMILQRMSCPICHSKLYTKCTIMNQSKDTTTQQQQQQELILMNMGPLQDDSLPKQWIEQWKQQQKPSSPSTHEAIWGNRKKRTAPLHLPPLPTSAQSDNNNEQQSDEQQPLVLKGGCKCGKCQYSFSAATSLEAQHCYCLLCRQLSGGPYMTWIPVPIEDWNLHSNTITDDNNNVNDSHAKNTPSLSLVRTTSHGQRHVCTHCHTYMTIVYDEDPTVVWPTAATLQEDSWNRFRLLSWSSSSLVERQLHICCRYRPVWYTLPKDGLPRVQEAS